MEYERIIKRIIKSTGIKKKVLENKIEDKIEELDKLVSREGAAHIIANELGVSLIDADASKEYVNVENLVGGLRNVIVIGRVVDVYPVNTYEKDGKELKVGALSLSDGTGYVRVVFWNDNIDLFNNIRENDVLKVINAYVKENKFGKLELHVSFRTKVRINPEDVDSDKVPSKSEVQKKSEEVDVVEIKKDTFVKVSAMIVQVFRSNCFFNVCPECGKSVNSDSGIFMCESHGKVNPKKKMRVSYVIDDGTDNIRVTSFGRDAEKVLGLSTKEAVNLADSKEDNKYPVKHMKSKIIGTEVIIYGRAQYNDFSDQVEVITNKVIKNIDYERELNKVVEEVEYGDTD